MLLDRYSSGNLSSYPLLNCWSLIVPYFGQANTLISVLSNNLIPHLTIFQFECRVWFPHLFCLLQPCEEQLCKGCLLHLHNKLWNLRILWDCGLLNSGVSRGKTQSITPRQLGNSSLFILFYKYILFLKIDQLHHQL